MSIITTKMIAMGTLQAGIFSACLLKTTEKARFNKLENKKLTDIDVKNILKTLPKNRLEIGVEKILNDYVVSHEIGKWLLSINGVDVKSAAGLVAHINIKKVTTSGKIHAYAGYDPYRKDVECNFALKTICQEVGRKICSVDGAYKNLYNARKRYENNLNQKGEYKNQAEMVMKKNNYLPTMESYDFYSVGKLPPSHIEQRAKRYVIKVFLSHLFEVWYELENGKKPPLPYSQNLMGETYRFEIPNMAVVGLKNS